MNHIFKKIEVLDLGDLGAVVMCDICNDDHTDKDVEGGMLFGSSGICPTCTERMLPNIKEFNEEEYIHARAEPGESFRAFSLRIRNGNNQYMILGLK